MFTCLQPPARSYLSLEEPLPLTITGNDHASLLTTQSDLKAKILQSVSGTCACTICVRLHLYMHERARVHNHCLVSHFGMVWFVLVHTLNECV